MERTLDDSANRRIAIAEAFLATDAILNLCANVADGLVVHRAQIAKRLAAELPFMATEDILMAAVKAGGDRQALHEAIREHAQAAAAAVKDEGKDNDLLQRLADDPAFAAIRDELPSMTDPARFVGRAPSQVDAFVEEVVAPVRAKYMDAVGELDDERITV
jgi:adenylosuccinate lyase